VALFVLRKEKKPRHPSMMFGPSKRLPNDGFVSYGRQEGLGHMRTKQKKKGKQGRRWSRTATAP
jgi:hypothetical protein